MSNRKSCFNALSICEWQLYPQVSSGAAMIGPSAPTRFWVGKTGANQVWKVLRSAPYEIRRKTFWKSTDHSAITLSINGIDVSKRDPSFWKVNCSLVNDNNYCDLFDTNIKSWLEEFKDVDKRVLWDLLKYKIRQLTINYSESICLSRVEGRGFHVEGEGTMSRRNAKPTLSLSFCRGLRVPCRR